MAAKAPGLRAALKQITAQEDLNFLLTNRIPRLAATRAMGRISRIEHPLVARPAMALWRLFCDVDLADAAQPRYRSLHAAFTRALRPGARAFDPDPGVLAAPCDAILGAHGPVRRGVVQQIKGFNYTLAELMGDPALAAEMDGGVFATLRLTAGMYHRFHAPFDLVAEHVRYIAGDTWNVNPIALKRVERLYCKNERAPIAVRLATGERVVLVTVAAVLVASIRLPFVDGDRPVRDAVDREWRGAAPFAKGAEMGWFEHGSTIVVTAPPGFALADGLADGDRIRAGTPLLRRTGRA